MRLLFAGLLTALVACSSPETSTPEIKTIESPETAVSTQEAEAETASNVIGMGHSYQIKSKTFNDDRGLTVRLPAGYAETPDKSYPVVYLIDGGVDQDFLHIAGIHQSRDMNWSFEPFILVGVETLDRAFELTPPHDDPNGYRELIGTMPGGAAQFRQFIQTDVMPWVDGQYRTNAQKAVIGESLAGLFIIDTLLKRPNLFDDYISISPSLWWNETRPVQNLKPVFDKFPEGDRRLYLSMADEGFLMREGLNQLVSSLQTSAPKDLKWTFFDRSNSEHHGSIYHVAALDAFRKLYPTIGRTGGSNRFLYKNGQLPELSEDAQASLKEECNLETAKKVSFAEKNKNPSYWNGMCVAMTLGIQPTSGNWD